MTMTAIRLAAVSPIDTNSHPLLLRVCYSRRSLSFEDAEACVLLERSSAFFDSIDIWFQYFYKREYFKSLVWLIQTSLFASMFGGSEKKQAMRKQLEKRKSMKMSGGGSLGSSKNKATGALKIISSYDVNCMLFLCEFVLFYKPYLSHSFFSCLYCFVFGVILSCL